MDNRVSEIHTIMSELESTLGAGTVYWRCVPTEYNPADNITRGLHPAQLKEGRASDRTLTVPELRSAQNYLMKRAQAKSFGEEVYVQL